MPLHLREVNLKDLYLCVGSGGYEGLITEKGEDMEKSKVGNFSLLTYTPSLPEHT